MTRALTCILSAVLAAACAPRAADVQSPAPVSAQPVPRTSTGDSTVQTSMNEHTHDADAPRPLPTEEPTSPQAEAPMANPLPPQQQPPVLPNGSAPTGRVPDAPVNGGSSEPIDTPRGAQRD